MILHLLQPIWGNDEDAVQFLVLYTQGTDSDKFHRCSLILLSPSQVYDPSATDRLVSIPHDVITWLRSNPDLKVGPAHQVTVGSITSRQVDVTAAPTRPLPDSCFGTPCRYQFPASGFPPVGYGKDDRFRIILLTVRGKTVIVLPESRFGAHAGCDFGTFGPEQRDLLQSLRFES